jgi:hypothetical protein
VTDVLSGVAARLEAGEPTAAVDLIRKARVASPWVVNASGVCHLRRGDADQAVQVFRGLVLGAGGIQLRPDAPATFKANLAAGLFAAGNVSGCLAVLAELRGDEHPAVDGVRRAVARWRKGLSFWQKVSFHLGGDSPVTVPPDERLGRLWP